MFFCFPLFRAEHRRGGRIKDKTKQLMGLRRSELRLTGAGILDTVGLKPHRLPESVPGGVAGQDLKENAFVHHRRPLFLLELPVEGDDARDIAGRHKTPFHVVDLPE
jgi:hypothetical protein